MKLIKGELHYNIFNDVSDKMHKHILWNSPVHEQIRKNFGWVQRDLFRLKILNTNIIIRNDLNETD